MEPQNKRKTLKRVLLYAGLIIIAFLAGLSGEFVTRTYLSKIAFFRDLYFTEADTSGQRQLVISQPNKVVVQQDTMVSQAAKDIQASVLGIYYQKKASKNLGDNLYLPTEMLGQALVLTSDGWLISSASGIGSGQGLAVYYNNKIYNVDKVVSDAATGATFLKINVQNLPVIKLADLQQVTLGQQVFVYDSYYQEINLANIIDRLYQPIFSKNDLTKYSQNFSRKILINKSLAANLAGSPVFDLAGEIVGLWSGAGNSLNSQVIPINYISPIISQILKGEKIQRPYLGIYYLNLAKTAAFSSDPNQASLKSGAYVQSVMVDSPLYGKIVKGDIILSIETQDIDEVNDLTDLLASYKSGQVIKLQYRHLDKEQEISITLK